MVTKASTDFNRGVKDGIHSAQLFRHFHADWPRNKSGKCVHHNREYFTGYKEGYQKQFGCLPDCLA